MPDNGITIKGAFDLRPTAGDDATKKVYIPMDQADGLAASYDDIQLANVMASRLGLNVSPAAEVPSQPIGFSASLGAIPQTQIIVSFIQATLPSGGTVLHDVVEVSIDATNGNIIPGQTLRSNVSSGDTVSNLTPNKTYQIAILAKNYTDQSKQTFSSIVGIKTDPFTISIDSLILDDAVDDGQATFATFTSTGIDQIISQVGNAAPPLTGDAWGALPTVGVSFVDLSALQVGVYLIYTWGRLSSDPSNITLVNVDTVTSFRTILIPNGDFDTDAITPTDWDNFYGAGGSGVFSRVNADCIVAAGSNETTVSNTLSGTSGKLQITVPVIESTDFELTVSEIDNVSSMIIDIDDTSMPAFNAGNLITGQVITSSTDTETTFSFTSGIGGGGGLIESFATDSTDANWAANYPQWIRVACTASCVGGVVTITNTTTFSGHIYYDDTVVNGTAYTFSLDVQSNPASSIIAINSVVGPSLFNVGDLGLSYPNNPSLTQDQSVFIATSTVASYGIWVNGGGIGDAINFRNPTAISGSGASNIYVSMTSSSTVLGDGFKLPRVYMNAKVNTSPFLLQVDFQNRVQGPYTSAQIDTDFQVNLNGKNEPNHYVDDMDLVNDPASAGKGTVLRVKRFAGSGWAGAGNGGMDFVADFTPGQTEVYLAYEMYLDAGHEFMKQMKNPGFITGLISDIGHPNFNTVPTPGNLKTFVFTVTSDGNSAWGRGDGALNTYYYDKEVVQANEFWDEVDPTFVAGANTSIGGQQYNQPTGRWIEVECRMKLNTVTVETTGPDTGAGLKDGIQEIRIKDPLFNGGLVKLVSSHLHKWVFDSSILIDGITMSQFYGGNGDDPLNQPSQVQYHYYNNFRVSASPILT